MKPIQRKGELNNGEKIFSFFFPFFFFFLFHFFLFFFSFLLLLPLFLFSLAGRQAGNTHRRTGAQGPDSLAASRLG